MLAYLLTYKSAKCPITNNNNNKNFKLSNLYILLSFIRTTLYDNNYSTKKEK